MDIKEKALKQHEEWQGKIEVTSRARLETPEDLSIAYTPGVAEPCLKIAEDKDLSYKYTRRGNMVAVVTDGTAVLVSDASSYELGAGDVGYYIRLDVSSDPTAPYSGEASFITVRPVEEEQLTFWEKLVRWFYSILAAIQALFDTMFSIGM